MRFFLGIGVYRLAQQQALVRRAVVVENIGRISCICSDKTGTLTEGRLKLAHELVADGIDHDTLTQAAALASRQESQDPLDMALLAAIAKPQMQVLVTFPFSEERRRETTLVWQSDKSILACVKGAPETVLAMCSLDHQQKQYWESQALEFASSGHKVIGFAQRQVERAACQGGEPTEGYTFLGLMAFEDPVRAGAKEAVQAAQEAGIRVIMVTGDHQATATAIARELGIGSTHEPVVVRGEALDSSKFNDIDVLARATPAQKLKLVRSLREQGEIVAVTGDGVNDVPALKGSDIGIAMGERGTQAAREIASIVLLDDNFRTIVRAIAQGRQLFVNLQISFAYLLMVHLPLVVTAAWIPLAGYPLLYLPVHIVWLELIIHPTALLAFQQRADTHRLAFSGSRLSESRFFDWQQWCLIILVAMIVTVVMLLVYVQSESGTTNIEHARAVALATLVISSLGITAGLSRLKTRAASVIVACVTMTLVVMLQSPLGLTLLQIQALHGIDWLIVLTTGVIVGVLAQWFSRRSHGKRDS
ncbi:MAG: HAD-IC family P-type ATPase [Burkholderiaceae bacterium]|nr:HAD-IC family P-type ATPase [Burkholderiaceae bacterium]